MGYPWAFTQRPRETLPMIHDFGGGSPCGGYIYCDDGLPEQFRGRIFHCEWGQGKVWAVKVVPDGAGFKYVDQIAFMDPTGTGVKDFRPFTIRPMADGRGFYVTDWALSGWMQKVQRGRLFNVTYVKDDVKPQPRGTAKRAESIEELIKALDHPARSERLRAQRELIVKGEKAFDAVLDAYPKLSDQGKGSALWVLRENAAARKATFAESWLTIVYKAIDDPSADVRIEAARVLGSYRRADGLGKIPYSADILEAALKGENNPAVRLQIVNALSMQTETIFGAKVLLSHLEKEKDHEVRRLRSIPPAEGGGGPSALGGASYRL